jgi:hypothetical protein
MFLHNYLTKKKYGKDTVYLTISEIKKYYTNSWNVGCCNLNFDKNWGVMFNPITWIFFVSLLIKR